MILQGSLGRTLHMALVTVKGLLADEVLGLLVASSSGGDGSFDPTPNVLSLLLSLALAAASGSLGVTLSLVVVQRHHSGREGQRVLSVDQAVMMSSCAKSCFRLGSSHGINSRCDDAFLLHFLHLNDVVVVAIV